ncbi:MAG TPA: hypothetical protein VF067_03520 [Sphingomicrobium sp.]
MQLNLVAHPATPPSDPEMKLWATVDHSGALGATATTNIWFGVGAPAGRFVIPESADPERTEDLWQTTCFEAFLRAEGEAGYREWNFAPSSQWAAYDFTSHREGRTDADVATPYIRTEDNLTWWALGATMAAEAGIEWQLGLSAILEEKDGTKSYWALAHPKGDKPDFHDSVCFAARLA